MKHWLTIASVAVFILMAAAYRTGELAAAPAPLVVHFAPPVISITTECDAGIYQAWTCYAGQPECVKDGTPLFLMGDKQ